MTSPTEQISVTSVFIPVFHQTIKIKHVISLWLINSAGLPYSLLYLHFTTYEPLSYLYRTFHFNNLTFHNNKCPHSCYICYHCILETRTLQICLPDKVIRTLNPIQSLTISYRESRIKPV